MIFFTNIHLFFFLDIVQVFPWPWRPISPIWYAIGQVFQAPFGSVSFLCGFIGDVFTSLVKVNIDIFYTLCFTFSFEWLQELEPDERPETCLQSVHFKRMIIPLISALPLWIRFLQVKKNI
jgi:hypothetical protein